MSGRSALIGATGFVGSVLKRQRDFSHEFASATIDDIASQSFDLVVCAGAPANMWMANQAPESDAANLDRLAGLLASARIGRLVLISTIAVFADASTGPDETSTAFETHAPYGRHRRALEVRLAGEVADHHILRLPSLIGPGLKKNFLFDLINPVPSFLAPAKWNALRKTWRVNDLRTVDAFYRFDPKLGMYAFARKDAAAAGATAALEALFIDTGFTAPMFANSGSTFQYYNLANLNADIETAIAHDLRVLNICSEPMRAGGIAEEVAGFRFDNATARLVSEDMRTVHAAAFGRQGPYLYDAAQVLHEMQECYRAERRA